MKGIRVSLKGLLLVTCAVVVQVAQVLPAQAASISINPVNSGEVMRQGTFPASPSNVYSHSPVLQELSYQFLGFSPTGSGLQEQERSGYLVYDLSGVTNTIIGASLAFDLNVTDSSPGELVVSTIDSSALTDLLAAPVGPLTQTSFDGVFAALSSGVTAATQVLSSGAATINIGLGAAGVSHLSSAVSLVGFHVVYAAQALQDLALAVDVAPRLFLTTVSPAVTSAEVPSPGTFWLFVGPCVLIMGATAQKRRLARRLESH